MSSYLVKGFEYSSGEQFCEFFCADNEKEVREIYQSDGAAVTEIKKLPDVKKLTGFGDGISFGMTDNIFIP